MAGKASELNNAIRDLLEEHGGDLTHAQARPLLQRKGFEIAPESQRKSDDLRAWEQTQSEVEGEPDSREFQDAVAEVLGWNRRKVNAVLAEIEARRLFKAESNTFDVTKYNWRQKKEGVTTSRKPEQSKDPKAHAAKKLSRTVGTSSGPVKVGAAKKKVTAADLAEMTEALQRIEEAGGIAAVQAQIEALQHDLELVQALKDRIDREAA